MKSKTKISKQSSRKTNPVLVETIINSKSSDAWRKISEILAGPRKNRSEINLDKIENDSSEGEVIVVPGKVLSQGELNKKVKVVALGFSDGAKEKLKNSKIEFSTIEEEIKNNPEAKGIRILR